MAKNGYNVRKLDFRLRHPIGLIPKGLVEAGAERLLELIHSFTVGSLPVIEEECLLRRMFLKN
jgi:hypothetical protein